jgi:hypothetical protein
LLLVGDVSPLTERANPNGKQPNDVNIYRICRNEETP